MPDTVWLGIDLGTSGCRVIAINQQESVVFEKHSQFTGQTYPTPTEQWQFVYQLLKDAVDTLQNTDISAIAVDATSGSVLVCDVNGEPLTEMLLYNDSIANDYNQQISSFAPKESAAIGAGSGLAKLLYLQSYHQITSPHYLVHQADWINMQLGSDVGITDYNNALKSGFDIENQCWPDWIASITSQQHLPKVVAPGTPIGKMSETLMQLLGLAQKTPPKIIAGTTDSMAAFIATGVSKLGEAVSSIGSTLVLKMITDKPVFSAGLGVYSHKLGDLWLVGGASNTGGAVLKSFFTTEQITALSHQIDVKQTPPDYYPLIEIGERFPVADPEKQAVLTPRPERDSLFLHGIFKGIANIEKAGYDKLQLLTGTTPTSIRTVGGGAQNPVWTTIRQHILNIPFANASHTQAAFGAALLAKNGLNNFEVNRG
ncbi:FGGY-family carbohydrate kinase [Methylophaga sp. OBS3]|uniref:FGGY-family carbohydrate kinase n=1 Tax=Methylophaga sp. OBS3 TaxID=2991934 RepID=UPI002252EB7B|nr:FGGY-family carbohydrate kinase [Methylophaga sp. OBS3]MCX4189190.1 FGGY-family carbohydrate kinase [Methylophaga sp. OBS3]